MKNNNNPHRMQPPDVEPVRLRPTSGSERIYSRVVTSNITGDVASAALLEALFDKDMAEFGNEEGFWLEYGVREMHRATNLTATEQRSARFVLQRLQLVNFATKTDGTGGMRYIINHPLFREKIAEQIGVPVEEWQG